MTIMTRTYRHHPSAAAATRTTASANQIEDELCKARAQLARLRKRQNSATAAFFGDASQSKPPPAQNQRRHRNRKLESAAGGEVISNGSNFVVDNPANENYNGGAEMELFRRAQKLQHRIEILGFNQSVLSALPLSPILSANSTITPSPSLILSAATELCTKLGLVLLQQHNRQQHCNNNHHQQQQTDHLHHYHEAIINWYHSLHKSSRAMATTMFRRELRKYAREFPSTELSSSVVAKALLGGLQFASSPPVKAGTTTTTATSAMTVKSVEAVAVPSCDSNWGDANVDVNGSPYTEWNTASKSLVELQVLHDALLTTTLGREQRAQLGSPCTSNWRLDILDEICRPLAERVRFHFLEERSGGLIATSLASPRKENEDGIAHHHQTSHFERLPEWLSQYLREVVQDHGVYSLVVLKGVQPLMDSVMESLIVRASAVTEASITNEEERGMHYSACAALENIGIHHNDDRYSVVPKTTSEHEMIRTLKRQYCDHAPSYFLQEVARMARHVLRAKSFFHHPDIVGSACCDRTVVLRGIEQLFLFDDFLMEKLREYRGERDYNVDIHDDGNAYFGGRFDFGNSNYLPPKLVDTFMSTNSFLLTWWLEEERDGTLQNLRQCASVTLLHAQYDQSEESDGGHGLHSPSHEASSSDRKQWLYPPISELFIALLHSARWKSNAFSDQKCRQLYIAEVVAPMCSQYLDLIHAEATYLRKRLLARRSRCNFPSDEIITLNVIEWSSLITGTNLVAQAIISFHHPLEGRSAIGQLRNEYGNDSRDELHLDRVGESMKRLCIAMIDDFTSALIETIVMERAQLASYMMRAPFMLSEPPFPANSTDHGSFMKKKQCHEVDRIDEAPSPDLTNSIHVVSVCVNACNMTELKLRKMSSPSSISSLNESSRLEFGCHSIRDAIKCAIAQKLLDIAIDPQGMTPEISLGGAIQFRHDVMCISRLFDEDDSGIVSAGKGSQVYSQTDEPGPMERAETASRLMSIDSSQLRTLREALRALLVDQNYESTTSLFGRGRGVPANECLDSEHRLIVDDYCNDVRLMEEAISMLKAKSFDALSLEEALSIINRRL